MLVVTFLQPGVSEGLRVFLESKREPNYQADPLGGDSATNTNHLYHIRLSLDDKPNESLTFKEIDNISTRKFICCINPSQVWPYSFDGEGVNVARSCTFPPKNLILEE